MPKLRKMMTASEVLAYLNDAHGPLDHDAEAHVAGLVKQMTVKNHLASVLVTRRNQLKLTQIQVAELAGLDQSEISKIEGPNGNPTVKTLDKVADALGLEIRLVPRQ
jgi:DNA-binding phage protein